MHCISSAPLCSMLRIPCSFSPAKWPLRSSHSSWGVFLPVLQWYSLISQINLLSWILPLLWTILQGAVRRTNFSSVNSSSCCCAFCSAVEKPAGCWAHSRTSSHIPLHTDKCLDVFEWVIFSILLFELSCGQSWWWLHSLLFCLLPPTPAKDSRWCLPKRC